MKTLSLTTTISVYDYAELNAEERALIDYAKKMTEHSYSPYSHFRVGAALRLSDGTLWGGANQENAAYPSGLCAERTALFSANATHPELAVEALAIAAFSDGEFTEEPIPPCGACRQVMTETENRHHVPMKVYLYSANRVYVIPSAADLMPLTFLKEDLLNQ